MSLRRTLANFSSMRRNYSGNDNDDDDYVQESPSKLSNSLTSTIIVQSEKEEFEEFDNKLLLEEINKLIRYKDIESFKQYVPKSIMRMLSNAVITMFGGLSPMISVWATKSSPTTIKKHDVEIMINTITRSIMEHECDVVNDVTHLMRRFSQKNHCQYYLIMDADRFMYLLIGVPTTADHLKPIRQYFIPFVSKFMRNTIRSAHQNAIPIIHTHLFPHLQGLLDISRLLSESRLTKEQKQYVAKIRECNL